MSIVDDPVAPDAVPALPPLLTGRETPSGVDPFARAIAAAAAGEEAGALYWSPDEDVLRMAVVFAPEIALGDAASMLFVAAVALNDSLGALGPPEMGVQHVWPDGVKVNGGWCGALRLASDAASAEETPDWMVVGVSLSREMPADIDPGEAPDMTALAEEGCGGLSRVRLIESWSRHLLTWVHRWETDGPRPIFDAWLNRAEGRGAEVAFRHQDALRRGSFLGLSERGDMMLKTPEGTVTLPLLAILDAPRAWPPSLPRDAA